MARVQFGADSDYAVFGGEREREKKKKRSQEGQICVVRLLLRSCGVDDGINAT
jgi:hypothetical protein